MTPGARVQAAIEVLDAVFAGASAERELTAWGRRSRFAGSKDRAAVRDHVFDALRRLRSSAWAGGLGDAPLAAMTGRQVMAGLLTSTGAEVDALFTGQGHAPAPWSQPADPGPAPEAIALDCPDWLLPKMRGSLGADGDIVLDALRSRAPIGLRVNTARTDLETLIAELARDGFETQPHPLATTALTVVGHGRGLAGTGAFRRGLFEFQDPGSQALVERLPILTEGRVLDLCAGGGGKILAYGARAGAKLFAHDVNPARMRDLPGRAERAGCMVSLLDDPGAAGSYDGVIADVPCSGSGSWRRAPEAKWRLTMERLEELRDLQGQLLRQALALTRPGGWTAYMTCSLLDEENDGIVGSVVAETAGVSSERRWSCDPRSGGDGFYLNLLRKK